MTANDDSDSPSDNSNPRDTTRRTDSDQDDPYWLVVLLRAADGWMAKGTLIYEYELTTADCEEAIEKMEDAGEIETHDLGKDTLLTLRDVDPKTAIAEYSDMKERVWRKLTDDDMPDIDNR